MGVLLKRLNGIGNLQVIKNTVAKWYETMPLDFYKMQTAQKLDIGSD